MEAEHDPYQAPAATAQVLEPRDRVSTWLRLAVGCYVAAVVLQWPGWVVRIARAPDDQWLAQVVGTAIALVILGVFVTCMVRWLRRGSWRARRWVVLWAVVEGGDLVYILWPPLAPVLTWPLNCPHPWSGSPPERSWCCRGWEHGFRSRQIRAADAPHAREYPPAKGATDRPGPRAFAGRWHAATT